MIGDSIRNEIENIIKSSVKTPFILGFSDLRDSVPEKYRSLFYGITVGLKLDDNVIDQIKEYGPTKEYVNLYYETNKNLKNIGLKIKDLINRKNSRAVIVGATVSGKDVGYLKNLTCEFSHKVAATRSGLGWIGKSALFISREFGARVRLITILTDTKLETGVPFKESMCNKCSVCVDRCPAGAISGKNWFSGMKREDFFNAFKCKETGTYLTKKNTGVDDCICGICVSVCPVGVRVY
ncbi:epoxyqueuosine reductase [candidate division KSB1 bacterium]|nr:MAG: epoxyqueuosine reductase [candidate division KSB1 bacterium]